MKRREALKNLSQTAFAAAAVSVLPKIAIAQEAKLVSGSEISFNHGHELALSTDEIVLGLREGGLSDVDIQGGSGHGHSVELTEDDLLAVLMDGEVEVVSTSGGSRAHTHSVKLTLK